MPRVRGLIRLAGILTCLMIGLATAPTAHAESSYAGYLDLPPINGDGAGGGGLNPALPLDPAVLRDALDQARAAGIAPHRYATLLHQYWLVVATRNADIDLATWDPALGVAANSRTFTQVYVNYLRLNNTHPDYWWTGLAGLAGGSFASGFFDMGDVSAIISVPGLHQVGGAVADLLRGTPAPLLDILPADIATLGTEGERLTAEDLAWYQTRLMIMQKHIFIDQVPMHEAYAADGPAGVEEMYRAGVLDENAIAAWREITAGDARRPRRRRAAHDRPGAEPDHRRPMGFHLARARGHGPGHDLREHHRGQGRRPGRARARRLRAGDAERGRDVAARPAARLQLGRPRHAVELHHPRPAAPLPGTVREPGRRETGSGRALLGHAGQRTPGPAAARPGRGHDFAVAADHLIPAA